MRCSQCQNEMNPQERFCSKCGTDSLAHRTMPSTPPDMRNWDAHVKVLAWIFICSSLFVAIPGISMMAIPGIMRIGMHQAPFHFAGPLFFPMGLMLISIPVVNVITGIGLLRYRDWARVLALILAVFMLIGFPFGTAIGIYALWVLSSTEGKARYRHYSASGDRGVRPTTFPPYRGA